ncbi:hypothetical protein [Oryzobacter terrae]|uniref:hypothetical protein n=1 Tax=Oryzobacter terrae TaxID=1620385 RepID=UPI0036722CD1
MDEQFKNPKAHLRALERRAARRGQARLIRLRDERRELARLDRIARRVPKDRGVVTCGWCGTSIKVARVGRMPKWCSSACRHRAWEQRRAAESGLVAVEVVDRAVEVIREVTKTETVPVVVSPTSATHWSELLTTLADRLDQGRIYDRDVSELLPAMSALILAFNRRAR